MSRRIRVDGRPYDPRTDLDIRPQHKPVMPEQSPYWKCAVCGAQWGWVIRRQNGTEFRRHFPGTFWERD